MKVKRAIIAVAIVLVARATYADTDKTLVSWATLTDRSVTAGSLLTIQDGREFDGIVFAENAEERWMAGSHNWARTEKLQNKNSRETADGKSMIQIAIVYKGKQVSIYRNGELYTSYETKNIDLLNRDGNFVCIGVRHVGGNGSIAGTVEDARIYARALTVSEIKSLKPNEGSDIKPYAWWSFEDDKIIDRTGRYPYQQLSGGARIEAGKLVLRRGAKLVAGRTRGAANKGNTAPLLDGPYIPETPAWPKTAPNNWPIYHLAHPTFTMGSPFDPNPAIFYKGRYHLHYIYKNHAGFVFAHVSSKDMVHWKWHPTVLAPPTTGHGMFSGTAFFTRAGKPAIAYCGWGSNRNWIQHALDDNLDKWSKPELMLPTDKDGQLMVNERYFDPDVWTMDKKYYGLNGRSSHEPPVIMKSENLKDWEYIGELLHPDFDEKKLGVNKSEDISCPNIFKLGDKWVLVCISHRLGCRYFIGDFKDEQFLPEYHAVLGGNSRRYFAPESLLTPDGRRVNWTWYMGGEVRGIQSLPTELELPSDGVMRIRPVKELEGLRYGEEQRENLSVRKDSTVLLDDVKGDHLEFELETKDPGDHDFGIDVLCNDQGKEGLRIKINRKENLLEVGNEKASFTLKDGEPLTLRIFVDATLVEVYANERQVVMTDKKRGAEEKINDRVVIFSLGGDLIIDKLTAWKMTSAYGNN